MVKRHEDGLGWKDCGTLRVRNYESAQAYQEKQAQKLDQRYGWCRRQSDELKKQLLRRFDQFIDFAPGIRVLCLGARLGGEVEAFIERGCFAVGIDLNPGSDNKYVLHGDFHNLQFASGSVDMVYLNCFDHCLDPAKVLSEIVRVLCPGGKFIMEAKAGTDESEIRSMGSDRWDCLEWKSLDELGQYVVSHGFILDKRYTDRKSRAVPYGFIFHKGDQ